MGSDKDIKTWDQRLKDQSIRHWENYKHLRIDLSTARVDEPLLISGEYLYVESASDKDAAIAKIKFNRNTNDALDLELGVEIKTVFIEVFITNDAIQGEWLDLIFGINFEYKKKIAGDGFTNPIVTGAGVDLVLLPGAGGITQIGDAGAQSRGLVNNDDLFVSGKLEVDGTTYIDGLSYFSGQARFRDTIDFTLSSTTASYLRYSKGYEEITIAAGQGAAGVAGAVNLALARSTIIGVVCRVSQAPGGGATTLDIGRTGGGNLDEFIDGIGVALNTEGHFAVDHDAATTGPVLNAANDTLTVTTDVNVVGASLKVRIYVFNRVENV
jgi:hypothetical protein